VESAAEEGFAVTDVFNPLFDDGVTTLPRKRIAIHGLGYVGLTAAVHWARAGWTVVGYDTDPNIIRKLGEGMPRAAEFLSYINADVAELVRAEKLVGTTSFELAASCPVQLIAVPTEKDGAPYNDIIDSVLHKLFALCPAGATILVESTLTPGTMDRFLQSVQMPPHHIHVAVCPRRDWFASRDQNMALMERNVGGWLHCCTDSAVTLLSHVSQRITTPKQVPHFRSVELTKAIENSLLHTQVMLGLELAMNRSDLEVAEAVRMATTHPRLIPRISGRALADVASPLARNTCSRRRGQAGSSSRPSRPTAISAAPLRARSRSVSGPTTPRACSSWVSATAPTSPTPGSPPGSRSPRSSVAISGSRSRSQIQCGPTTSSRT
jgi:hypothetical protein